MASLASLGDEFRSPQIDAADFQTGKHAIFSAGGGIANIATGKQQAAAKQWVSCRVIAPSAVSERVDSLFASLFSDSEAFFHREKIHAYSDEHLWAPDDFDDGLLGVTFRINDRRCAGEFLQTGANRTSFVGRPRQTGDLGKCVSRSGGLCNPILGRIIGIPQNGLDGPLRFAGRQVKIGIGNDDWLCRFLRPRFLAAKSRPLTKNWNLNFSIAKLPSESGRALPRREPQLAIRA